MGKTIVVSNQKGGCGKTNAAVNLGVGLARQGERVLLIDADMQNSLTISLGITEPDKLPVTLASVIASIISDADFDPTAGIYDPKGKVAAAYASLIWEVRNIA